MNRLEGSEYQQCSRQKVPVPQATAVGTLLQPAAVY